MRVVHRKAVLTLTENEVEFLKDLVEFLDEEFPGDDADSLFELIECLSMKKVSDMFDDELALEIVY